MQLGRDRHLEEMGAPQTGGEEEHLQVLDFPSFGIQTGNDLVAQLFGFLFRIRRPLVDVEDVPLAVILEGQLRVHSTSPWGSQAIESPLCGAPLGAQPTTGRAAGISSITKGS